MDIKKAIQDLQPLDYSDDSSFKRFLEKYGNVDPGDIPVTEDGVTLNNVLFALSQRSQPKLTENE